MGPDFSFFCVNRRRRRCSVSKKLHMCQCVCYNEGTLKQFNAPSVRKLKTNQNVESFRPQFLHKEAILLLPFCYSKTPRHVGNTTLIPKRDKRGTKISKEGYQQARSDHQDLPCFLSTSCFLSPHLSPLLSRPAHGERVTAGLLVASPTSRPHSIPGTACPGPCGSSVPPLPTP